MIKPQAAQPRHGRGQRSRHLTFALSLLAALCTAPVAAQAPASPVSAAAAPVAEELETLVGRIALYPDDLIGIILPSSTNPLQIVQADRYLQKRKADPKAPIDEKWDDAVKSLLNYPDVVKMMSDDLDWTSALGEAVVADAGAVLEGVQAYRRKAQSAGNLKTDDKQTVQVEKEVITIVQSNPEVIYVPAIQPDDGDLCGLCGLGLLPHALPRLLLPLCAGRRLRHRADLGRGHRRGLERRPLRHAIRRQQQYQYRPQHQYQHRQRQSRRQAQPGRRVQSVEVQQAARAGEQFRGQDARADAARRLTPGGRRTGRRWRRAAVDAAVGHWRRRQGRRRWCGEAVHTAVGPGGRWRQGRSRQRCQPGQPVGRQRLQRL
ncbi:MAG: DUF3300 domain-containing protein [Rubrivivax sp.]|nr:DUF3300 domain-containing protein [Rubrivivax sp.]